MAKEHSGFKIAMNMKAKSEIWQHCEFLKVKDEVSKTKIACRNCQIVQWIPFNRNPDNSDFPLFATFCLAPILFSFRQCKIHRIIGTLIKDIFGSLQQKSSHRL